MQTKHSIAGNLITKAVLPFVLTLLLFSVFSCKKDDNKIVSGDNGDTILYSGWERVVKKSPGGGEWEVGYNDTVQLVYKLDDLITINYTNDYSVRSNTVILDSDSTFADSTIIGSKFWGRIWDDSIQLHFSGFFGVNSFSGKKQ